MDIERSSFDLTAVRQAYAQGTGVRALITEARRRAAADRLNAYIHVLSEAELEPYVARLERLASDSLPLYGLPFAIKDNIDLAGVPTTAACPQFAYTPGSHAHVVEKLIAAGAVPIGKTNLDQFATGLNGTRSPYGPGRNPFNPDYISGGSSSGSAIAVATGSVGFALGTDTAGSGRVPAAFNKLIGLKPTCGLLSARGVVPACRSLDTVSIFALTAEDAADVYAAALGFDAADAYARRAEPHGPDFAAGGAFRVGVPRADQLEFFGDEAARQCFAAALELFASLGATLQEVDFAPFLETARTLYGGPWVAERHAAIGEFFDQSEAAVIAPVREIVAGARRFSATDAMRAMYALKAARRRCDSAWENLDCMLAPTAGSIYTIAELEADPIRLNSALGYYTNFMNLLDYCAVALPAGTARAGLPWGVTIFAPAHRDLPLLRLAARAQQALGGTMGATAHRLPAARPLRSAVASGCVLVAVCGAHMEGLPLNVQLRERAARLVARTRSAPEYRFYALPGGPPERPGMVRVDSGGACVELEIWEMPAAAFGSFVAAIPAPLAIGKVKLADGAEVPGFVCESWIASYASDITHFGGWRAYQAARG
ncbi:MAG: allophanate hydrolase [Rhodocyclaceae bacterium]|nr:allophanate hydrolase [Rhodocyclaceae bacterium]MBX3666873.1 allophanate hydrolase [Rhodocyclaceae bacterium]